MSYPQEFSSELTYESRYDLDELDVFIEGDGNNPMFFSVSGLPHQLSFGKHYFYISLLDLKKQDYNLKNNSEIIFEFKSLNGVILKSVIIDLNQRNGVATCYVEILKDPMRTYKEVQDGEGTLIVAAILENKENTINRIPKQYEKVINYKCVFPIEIRKNLLNSSSPRPLSSEHKLSTTLGQFSFIKGAISTRRNTTEGTSYKNGNPLNTPVPKGTTS